MIVGDETNVCLSNHVMKLIFVDDVIVREKSLSEISQVLAIAIVVIGADLTLHSVQAMDLRSTSTRSQLVVRSHLFCMLRVF